MSAARTTDYLLAYDLSDDRERRRVDKLLCGYGFRRQYSLFICRLPRHDKQRLQTQLQELQLESGFVLVVRMAGQTAVTTIGICTRPDPDADFAYVV